MSHDTTPKEPPVPPLRTDYELRFIAFQMATKCLCQKPPKEHPLTQMIEEVLVKMRDECDARIAAQNAELVEQQRYILQLEREVTRMTAELAEREAWESIPEGAFVDGNKTLHVARMENGDTGLYLGQALITFEGEWRFQRRTSSSAGVGADGEGIDG